MAGTIQRPQPNYEGLSGGDRLEGWKAIAEYLKKTERTVQRWEKNKGLPVRRLEPNSQEEQPRVFAYRLEIDGWWEEQTRLGLDEARTQAAGAVAEKDAKWFSWRYAHYIVPFAFGLILAVVAIRIAWPRIQRALWSPATLTLAILPIKESGGDPESKRIANDLTYELISRVAKLQPGKLVVAEIASADAGLSVDQFGRKFKADYILKGELHRAEGRIAI